MRLKEHVKEDHSGKYECQNIEKPILLNDQRNTKTTIQAKSEMALPSIGYGEELDDFYLTFDKQTNYRLVTL